MSILFQAINHLKAIWMLRVSTCFINLAVIVWSAVTPFQCPLPHKKADVNSVLGESSKEHSSSTISTKASFDDVSNKESVNLNNVLSAIIENK